jgi:hypothetical protein
MENKIVNNLEFKGANSLLWYTGLYLGLPRIFMSVVKKKIIHSPIVSAILIPLAKIEDPVTHRIIEINITSRYFFIGANKPLESELELGIKSNLGTIIIMRDDSSKMLKQINIKDIQRTILAHKHSKRDTLQEHVPVVIKQGTFKSWEGVIVEKSKDEPEVVGVKFQSDDYSLSLKMPVALCEAI